MDRPRRKKLPTCSLRKAFSKESSLTISLEGKKNNANAKAAETRK